MRLKYDIALLILAALLLHSARAQAPRYEYREQHSPDGCSKCVSGTAHTRRYWLGCSGRLIRADFGIARDDINILQFLALPMKRIQIRHFLGTCLVAMVLNASAQSWITDGLVAYYPFSGNANDAVGTNHGEIFGATLADDMFGNPNQAYYFKGTNSWIRCSDGQLPFGNAPRTVSLWIRWSSFGVPTPTDTPFITYGSGQANDTYYAILFGNARPNNPIAVGQSGGGDAPQWAGTEINRWYHVAFSHDGAETWLYVDGISRGAASRTYATVLDGNFFIGCYTHVFGWSDTAPTHHGFIDSIRVYNRALSLEEMAQLYEHESLQTSIASAVRLDHRNLMIGTNYQLQVSSDLTNWISFGPPFEATNSSVSQYLDVENRTRFFRLRRQ